MKSKDIVICVVSYILERPMYQLKDLTLEELTLQFNVSRSFLNNKFKDILGVSPGKYIQSVKMLHAASLLVECPCMTINDLTDMAGFSSCDYFSQVFKSHFGVPPGTFRKARLKACLE
ncbi:MAG: helix-turn-helix transcriptional regulator [bacterium]|nr:helix-turn-helix transcriptional regulator [bacterium]